MTRKRSIRRAPEPEPDARVDTVRAAYACADCGYGIVVAAARQPRCPMCGTAAWKPIRLPRDGYSPTDATAERHGVLL